ncbi:DciA family protein [Collinsella vaginalis]|uniref:DciA family protein n=1 Tax=Collinsella vaginalis TaxID=1870987 RepID=UPI000A26782E|nr:DciA family protein [Collinsella vaginalis]
MARRDVGERTGEARGLGSWAAILRGQIYDGSSPERRERLRAAERRGAVFSAFNAVVKGTREGSHVTGLHFVADENKLIIYVEGSSWTQELTMLREIIRARMAAQGASVDELVFLTSRTPPRCARKDAPAAKKAPAPTPVPLTEKEEGEVEEIASRVSDPILREAVLKAMRANFEWKKGSEGKKAL